MDLLRRAVGESSLTYIGLSYGTFLGATYANLFPDKVRALVLDGTVAPAAWTGTDDPFFSVSMRIGTDAAAAKTLDTMLTLCGTVTTRRREFSAGTPAATTQKFAALLARLHLGPITIPGHTPTSYAHLLNELATGGLDLVAGWPQVTHALQLLWTSAHRPTGCGRPSRRPPRQPAATTDPSKDCP